MTQKPFGLSSAWSARLCNASIWLYTLWVLLPAVQRLGKAVTGVLAIALFGVGVLLDREYLRRRWVSLTLRVVCALCMPLILYFLCRRGTSAFVSYYCQQGMFWFPLIFCAYARERGDARITRGLKWALLGAMTLTALTTTGWLIEGMLRGDRVYAYSRALGSAEPNREPFINELMLRNIGGYDFIYALMLALPILCYLAGKTRGWQRAGWLSSVALALICVALSQYTYALIFAVGIVGTVVLGWGFRAIARGMKKRLSVGASLLMTLPLYAALYLLRVPLLEWAISVVNQLGLGNFSISLTQLLDAVKGVAATEATRLDYYRLPLQSIAGSPLLGGLLGQRPALSQHSDLLDLVAALGVLGAACFGGMVWLTGRGTLKGLGNCEALPYFLLQYVALAAMALLGTVTYSRDVSLTLCLYAVLLIPVPQPGQ
ncbi:MAG: hypothetical protein EOM69_04015 [Clostridia bacterium]|nr:hypothetical protein [Clostridia bacterium]